MKRRQIYFLLIFIFIYPKSNALEPSIKNENKPKTTYQGKNKLGTDKDSLTFDYSIYSDILQEHRNVNIALPKSYYDNSTEFTYPVFLLLEDEFFQMTCGVISHLSSVERMPECIIVSLADGPMTPEIYTNASNFWPGNKTLGGDDDEAFTKYLKQELFPLLKGKFRANDFHMVMGASYTSIYVLHSFTKEPELFDAHIAIASGDILSMGYSEGERFIDLFVADLENKKRTNGYLYVTSADADGAGRAPEIHENLKELNKRLAPHKSEEFKYISKTFPNEGHYDVVLPGLLESLGLIFPKDEWFVRYRQLIAKEGNAWENINLHFQNLSQKYGFEIRPRAERWRSGNRLSWVGPYLLRQNRIPEATQVMEGWVEYRPTSDKALSELSKAYEANLELERALQCLKRAHALTNDLDKKKIYTERISDLEDAMK